MNLNDTGRMMLDAWASSDALRELLVPAGPKKQLKKLPTDEAAKCLLTAPLLPRYCNRRSVLSVSRARARPQREELEDRFLQYFTLSSKD